MGTGNTEQLQYRVWDNNNKIMYYNECLNLGGTIEMQYITTKDGEPMYECDTVKGYGILNDKRQYLYGYLVRIQGHDYVRVDGGGLLVDFNDTFTKTGNIFKG